MIFLKTYLHILIKTLDENFRSHLQDILQTCRREDKPKLPATPKTKPKRKLFTANFGDEDMEDAAGSKTPNSGTPKQKLNTEQEELVKDLELTCLNGLPQLNILNKHLEAIKTGKPVFKITPPRSKENPQKGIIIILKFCSN